MGKPWPGADVETMRRRKNNPHQEQDDDLIKANLFFQLTSWGVAFYAAYIENESLCYAAIFIGLALSGIAFLVHKLWVDKHFPEEKNK